MKAPAHIVVGDDLGANDLDGDFAIELRIHAEIDGAVRSFTQALAQDVAVDRG